MPALSKDNPTRIAPRAVLTIDGAAEALSVHPRTIRYWVANGTLKAYRVGPKLIRIDAAALDALLRPFAGAGGDDAA